MGMYKKFKREYANVGELGLSVKQVLRLSRFESYYSHKMGMRKTQDSDADLYGDIGYSNRECLSSEAGIKGSIPFISTQSSWLNSCLWS